MVLAGLNAAQQHSYHAVTLALVQSFTLQGLVHLYQAELKARRKKGDESMAGLGRNVKFAYPSVDGSAKGVIGVTEDPGLTQEPSGSSGSWHGK